MARAPLSETDVAEFRRKTVVAATRLFAEQGYRSVTMRAIATALGTSAMAPYRYFENKAEIFAMVRAEAYRRFADGQEAAFESSEEPLERLFVMRNAYVRFALENADAYRVMFELEQEPETRYPALATESRRAFSALERAVQGAIDARILEGDAKTVAHLLWSQLHGMVSLHLAGKLTVGRTLEELLHAPPLRFLLGES
ncbi:MAG TPA: TetR/AcrR family transcriptional regulator [Polyangiaceae bacterium]|nr:TetR/AcrR family transcriptional regulator [Polyangiaceae bacterium]